MFCTLSCDGTYFTQSCTISVARSNNYRGGGTPILKGGRKLPCD